MIALLAGEDVGHLARQDGVDGRAVAADREGVADALGAVGVAQPHRVQLEGAHLAMRAVGERSAAAGCDRSPD